MSYLAYYASSTGNFILSTTSTDLAEYMPMYKDDIKQNLDSPYLKYIKLYSFLVLSTTISINVIAFMQNWI